MGEQWRGFWDGVCPSGEKSHFSTWEKWVLGLLFLSLVAIKVLYALNFRIESDELQHLHVVWGWATGRLQYRDIFDNHGPLFHFLFAPIFKLFGERADIVIPMRFAMFPLWGWSLWCVYRIGKSLYSERVGIWAVLLTAFFPEFLFTSTEFRTDDLWMALWLTVLSLLVGGKLTRGRAFLAGLLLGAAFTVTVKSGLMIGALATGGMWIGIWKWKRQQTVDWKNQLGLVSAASIGLLILPAAFTAYFRYQGAFDAFIYCNISHNLVPHTQNWSHFDGHLVWLPIAMGIAAVGLIKWNSLEIEVWGPRIFIALVTLFYFAALKTLFPTLTRQDDLPYLPLLAIFASAAIHFWMQRPTTSAVPRLAAALALPALVLVDVACMFRQSPPLRNQNGEEIATLTKTLRVAKRGNYVMDAIGETIFRDRPYYYAIEAFTKARFAVGLIPNQIADSLVANGVAVVRSRGLPDSTKRFVEQNYIDLGADLCVLGKVFRRKNGQKGTDPIHFKTAVPGRFVVLSKNGEVLTGKLDGIPFKGGFVLSSGPHVLSLDSGFTDRVAIFWESAFQEGFRPFKKNTDGEGSQPLASSE